MASVKSKTKPKAKRRSQKTHELPERLPVAAFKAGFSHYLREVQARGQAITITMHGRDVAVLSPPQTTATTVRAPLKIRPRLDHRPLGELIKGLKPLPGSSRVSEQDIQGAIDWTREDRF